MLKLIIEDDEGKTTVVPLIRDEITIGRKEGNTIRLTERNVSRRHAKITRQNGQVVLEDLNSYNGIKVNGSRISGQAAVGEGDRIQIGDYMLAFKQDQPVASAAPADPFDEMKTIPVEKAEAKALAAHIAAQSSVSSAAVPAPDETPTRQLQQDLIAEAAQVVDTRSEIARTVVVSSNFAGLECTLDKAAQVIGRTEDNDIVINHRSISRHHAKIVRDGATYTIVDQGSANGVFVNGEKYDRVELRPGDMVDLGHVRMRFVGPGETWVFDPTTAVDTTPTPARSNATLYGIIGAVIAIAAIVGILFGTGVLGDKKKKDKDSGQSKKDPMSETMKPDSMAPAEPVANYQPSKDAIGRKDWAAAIKAADEILINDGNDSEAKKLKAKAQEEQKNKGHRDRFFDAVATSDIEKAVLEGSQIATDSVYYAEVSKRLKNEKARYKPQLLKKGKRHHKQGECNSLREIAKKMQAIDPAETAIGALVRTCKQKEDDPGTDPDPPVMRRAPRNVSMRVVVDRPVMRPDPPAMREAGGGNAKELYLQARAAWLAGMCGQAIRLATKANKIQFSRKNIGIIGACACSLGRRGQAKRAYKILRGGERNMLLQVCRSKGIELP
ncbi:MAG: FHA domain-containing protein [bacterium]